MDKIYPYDDAGWNGVNRIVGNGNTEYPNFWITGSPYQFGDDVYGTGTRLQSLQPEIDLDALWDKMYIKAQSVIVQCPYCKAHNAISNPTCVKCGGPLD